MWERFGFICSDMASAEPGWYLYYPFAYHTSTYGSTVKCVFYCYCRRSGVRICEETNVFLHQIKLNGLEWSPSGQSCSGFKGLDQESWKSLLPDGLHQEFSRSIPVL